MKTRFAILAVALSTLLAAPAIASDDGKVADGSCPVSSEDGDGLADFGHALDSIFHHIGHGLHEIGDAIVDHGAQITGYIELAGIRYPVKSYQEEVSPTFWRGSRLGDEEFADLAARGFKATVDLTKEGTGDAENAPKYGLNTMNIPTLDNSHPTEAQMIDFLDFVTAPENQPVYVHCEAGVGRTSIATAVYKMAVLGVPPADALEDAIDHGMGLPNQQNFVKQFAKDLYAGKFTKDGFPPPVH